MKTTVYGSPYFAWYDPYEAAAFAEGRRVIGKPPLKPGEKLLMDRKTGQYKIEVPDPPRETLQEKGVTMKIPNLILNLLTLCRVEGNKLYLPPRDLDRSVYNQVNKVLELLGGKWNRSAKAHVFDHDIAEHIEQCIVAGEVVDKKKQYQFFPTPAKVAAVIIEKAGIKPGDFILEPSAGTGGIADAVPEEYRGNLLCIELNPDCAEVLKQKGYRVLTQDYLESEVTGEINRIVMNPPFTRQQDIAHVLKAYGDLAPGGRLVAVVSESCFFRQDKTAVSFREFLDNTAAEVIDLDAGEFRSSGTMVKTRIIIINKEAVND